ncbi:MAG TPA: hypothetical protein VF765_34640 [Polyangiaceae bacterium]
MTRWPVLVFVGGVCACGGTRVEAGLANAPQLGGATSEQSADVIVKMPARTASSHPVASSWLLPGASAPEGQSLVLPWLEHFYVGWPCANVERRSPPVTTQPVACKQ